MRHEERARSIRVKERFFRFEMTPIAPPRGLDERSPLECLSALVMATGGPGTIFGAVMNPRTGFEPVDNGCVDCAREIPRKPVAMTTRWWEPYMRSESMPRPGSEYWRIMPKIVHR